MNLVLVVPWSMAPMNLSFRLSVREVSSWMMERSPSWVVVLLMTDSRRLVGAMAEKDLSIRPQI